MFFVVLCLGTPEGSTGSGSGFKASQRMGQRLKASSDRLGEAGNRTCEPWFTRHRLIPYIKLFVKAATWTKHCEKKIFQEHHQSINQQARHFVRADLEPIC